MEPIRVSLPGQLKLLARYVNGGTFGVVLDTLFTNGR